MRVSRNAYYNWIGNDCTIKQKDSLINLKQRIKKIFNNSKQVYGSSRIQKMLERENLFYSRSYISILMKELGLRSILKKKFTITTDYKHEYPISDNDLNRDFESSLVVEKWVSDITYVRVGDDWNYLTTIIDLADRKVVGWTLSDDMTVENTIYKT
ncbi:MAG: IS3 family transposase, partial [Chlamydiia bacterium]|nr:IS3 family transposase [Chlamydiia bacterium]